jgi:acetone carboxylase gamma subunit
MLPLADVLFSIEKYKAMKQRNSYPILGHASCHSQEEWHLDSSMLRSTTRIMRLAYMSAMGSMSFTSKRQAICVTVFLI